MKFMRYLFLNILLLFSLLGFSQLQHKIDSLNILPKDTNYINEIQKLVSEYERVYPNEIDSLILATLPITLKLDYESSYHNLLIQRAIIFTDQTRYQEADSILDFVLATSKLSKTNSYRLKSAKVNILTENGNYKEAKQLLLNGLNIDDENQIELTINLARLYLLQNQYDSSLYYNHHCLNIITPKSQKNLSTIYNNLAVAHNQMDNRKLAKSNYEKAKVAALENNHHLDWIYAYGNLSVMQMEEAKWDTALYMLTDLLETKPNNIPITTKTWLLNCLGVCQLNLKNFSKAEKTFAEVAVLANKTHDPLSVARAIFNVGNTLIRRGNVDEGFLEMKKSYLMAMDASLFHSATGTLKKLSQFYNQFNQHDSAYHYLNAHYVLVDSLNTDEIRLKYFDIQEKYENGKLASELNTLSYEHQLTKKNNQLMLVFSLLMAALASTLIYLVKTIKQKNKQTLQLSDEKLELLKCNEAYHKQVIKEKEQRIVNIKEQLANAIGIEKQELRDLDFSEIIALTDLKPRHIKPLIALCSGITNQKEMAVQLDMEVGTVRKYIQQIREILDVPSTLKILPKLYEIIDKKGKKLS
jgi:tetratricopeptide (TPR) repeat protein